MEPFRLHNLVIDPSDLRGAHQFVTAHPDGLTYNVVVLTAHGKVALQPTKPFTEFTADQAVNRIDDAMMIVARQGNK